MIDEKSWTWNDLFTLITFDLRKIIIGIVLIAIVVAVLNGLIINSGIQDIYQCLLYDSCREYVGWAVNDLLFRRYIILTDLIIGWDAILVFLVYFLGLLAAICSGFVIWKQESVKRWLEVYIKSPGLVLLFKLGVFFVALVMYAAGILLSWYVYFLMMRRVIPVALVNASGGFSFRLFLNVSQPNLLLWFLAAMLAFGFISAFRLLTQKTNIGFFLGFILCTPLVLLFVQIRMFIVVPLGLMDAIVFVLGILVSYLLAWRLLIKERNSYVD